MDAAGDGRTSGEVDGFLEDVGERLGSAVAVVGRAFRQLGGNLIDPKGPPRERAESIVAGIEERLGDYTATVGHGVRRVAARAKEEYDDILAEAELKKEQYRGDGSAEPATVGEPGEEKES